MKEDKVVFSIGLDEKKIPEKITWLSEGEDEDNTPVEALQCCMWDTKNKDLLRIDLWTKNMTMRDMKMMHVNVLGAMSQSIMNATQDGMMAQRTRELADELFKHIEKEIKDGKL